MKYILILISFFLLGPGPDPKHKVIGMWAESWDEGIDYVDTLRISLDSHNNIQVKNLNTSGLVFSKITFYGSKFSFKSENKTDPEELFFVNYNLRMAADGRSMEGSIRNKDNFTTNVHLVKLPAAK